MWNEECPTATMLNGNRLHARPHPLPFGPASAFARVPVQSATGEGSGSLSIIRTSTGLLALRSWSCSLLSTRVRCPVLTHAYVSCNVAALSLVRCGRWRWPLPHAGRAAETGVRCRSGAVQAYVVIISEKGTVTRVKLKAVCPRARHAFDTKIADAAFRDRARDCASPSDYKHVRRPISQTASTVVRRKKKW